MTITNDANLGSVTMPVELAVICEQSPLLPGETQKDVRDFRLRLAAELRPADLFEWMMLIRMADLFRTILFYEAMKRKLMEDARRQVVENCLKDMPDNVSNMSYQLEGAKREAFVWYSNRREREAINDKLAGAGYKPEFIDAKAFELCSDEIRKIDAALSDLDARQFAARREWSLRGPFGRKLRDKADALLAAA